MSLPSKDLYQTIKTLLHDARNQVVRSVNTTMVHTYFEIGRLIVDHEQAGKEKALYGQETLKPLSVNLTEEFGKGFSVTNLQQMGAFFLAYQNQQTSSVKSQKGQIASAKFTLSWSHYLKLMRISHLEERQFYEIESSKNNWSFRELERQFASALYERIVLSRDKKGVLADNLQKYHTPQKPEDVVKDPYILEFLGLKEEYKYTVNYSD